MRVLWLTPGVPHPDGPGGWVHEFELLAPLARRHDIEVVSAELDGLLDEGPLVEAGASFRRVPWTLRPYPRDKARIALAVLRANPSLAAWLKYDALRALREAVRQSPPVDLVHITLGELAPLIDAAGRTPTALLLFDSLTRELDGRLATEPLRRRRAQLRVERRRVRRFEQREYARATGVACVSGADARWLEHLLGRPVDVVENPVPDRLFDAGAGDAVTRSATTVTFVGTLAHPPNADAIEWLAAEIWPLVQAERPDAELEVVGRGDTRSDPVRRLTAAVERAGGTLHANVAHIEPHYATAAAVVAPMRHGAGLRNKVVHAMAAGAPVVATPVALEGVPPDAARGALAAATAADFAQAIVTTLADPQRSRARARVARDGVAPLRADLVAGRLEAWWERTVRAAAPNRAW